MVRLLCSLTIDIEVYVIDSLTFCLADTGETIIYYHRHIISLYAIFIIMHIIIYIWTSIFYKKKQDAMRTFQPETGRNNLMFLMQKGFVVHSTHYTGCLRLLIHLIV